MKLLVTLSKVVASSPIPNSILLRATIKNNMFLALLLTFLCTFFGVDLKAQDCPYPVPPSSGVLPSPTCPIDMYHISYWYSGGNGNMYVQAWNGTGSSSGGGNIILPRFPDTTSYGLPQHPNEGSEFFEGIMRTGTWGATSGPNRGFPKVDITNTSSTQIQVDGYWAIPDVIDCVPVSIPSNMSTTSGLWYAGESINNMQLILAKSPGNGNPNMFTADIDLTTMNLQTVTVDECTFKLLRIRAYLHSPGSNMIQNGLTYDFGDGPRSFYHINFSRVGQELYPVSDPDTDDLAEPILCTEVRSDDGAGTLGIAYPEPGYVYKDANDILYRAGSEGSLVLTVPPYIDPRYFTDTILYMENTTGRYDCDFRDGTRDFSCFLPAQVKYYEPQGTGLLNQVWIGADATGGDISPPNNGDGSIWDDADLGPFNGPVDIFGLPTHGGGPPTDANFDCIKSLGLSTTYDDECGIPITNNAAGKENIQQDGWIAVPQKVQCLRLARSNENDKEASSALYIIFPDGSTTEVWNDRNGGGTYGSRQDLVAPCIDGHDWPTFGNDWKLIRVRLYHHDQRGLGMTMVYWDLNVDNQGIFNPGGAHEPTGNASNAIQEFNLFPALSPTSLIPPVATDSVVGYQYGYLDPEDPFIIVPDTVNNNQTKLNQVDIRIDAYTTYSWVPLEDIDCATAPPPTITTHAGGHGYGSRNNFPPYHYNPANYPDGPECSDIAPINTCPSDSCTAGNTVPIVNQQ